MGLYSENYTTYKVSQIHLKRDGTFAYVKVNPVISIKSTGEWKMLGDTAVSLTSSKKRPIQWFHTKEYLNKKREHVVIRVQDSSGKPIIDNKVTVFAKSKSLDYFTSNNGEIHINNKRIRRVDSLHFESSQFCHVKYVVKDSLCNEFLIKTAPKPKIDIHYRYFKDEIVDFDKQNMLLYLDSEGLHHFYYLISKY